MKGNHWTEDAAVRENWKDKTIIRVREAGLDPVEPPIILKLGIYEPDKRRRDTLNYGDEGLHGIQDGLVAAGLLEDDDYRFIRDVYLSYGYAKEMSHTIVTLFEIEELKRDAEILEELVKL